MIAPISKEEETKPSIAYKVFSLSHSANTVYDIDALIKLREDYIRINDELRNQILRQRDISLPKKYAFLKPDPVVFDFGRNGGVGIDFSDTRSQNVLSLIKDSLSKMADSIADIDFDEDEKATYNPDTKTINFKQKNIKITDRAQSFSADLLKTLFGKLEKKTWAVDEIYEDWYMDEENQEAARNANRAYHAGLDVNKKVQQETNCKDFLTVTTLEISINPRYL